MNIWSYEHLQDLTMEKPVGGSLQIFKATRNKLFAGNEERIDNHTLMLVCFTHTYQDLIVHRFQLVKDGY